MSTAPFSIGQTVYVAWANPYAEERIPCPICAGNRSVVLILGSGEHVPVECEGCGLGYDGPTGTVKCHRAASGIQQGAVTGLLMEGERWSVVVGGNHPDLDNVFADSAAAEARRHVLHKEAETQAERAFESGLASKRKHHAWTVRYHREQIAELKRRLAYHEGKLADRSGGEKEAKA